MRRVGGHLLERRCDPVALEMRIRRISWATYFQAVAIVVVIFLTACYVLNPLSPPLAPNIAPELEQSPEGEGPEGPEGADPDGHATAHAGPVRARAGRCLSARRREDRSGGQDDDGLTALGRGVG